MQAISRGASRVWRSPPESPVVPQTGGKSPSPFCYEAVSQVGDCGRVLLERFDQSAIRARSTRYVCDVEFGLRNLPTWVQAHQEGSRNPNRKIFSFAGALSSLVPADFSSSWFGILTSGAQAPFLPYCLLPGSRPATLAAVQAREALSFARWCLACFCSGCLAAQAGISSSRPAIAPRSAPQWVAAGKARPLR